MARSVVADQPIQVGDGGGQVRTMAFIDQQTADHPQALTINGRQLDIAAESHSHVIHERTS